MTLKFYNNNFLGISFNTLQEGLELIRDNLIGAGWFVELDDIDPNLQLRIKGFDERDNSDECFFIFEGNVDGNIQVKGYLGNDADEESSPEILKMTDGEDNRLIMTADSGAGVLFIKNGGFFTVNLEDMYNGTDVIHFGFLDRALLNDDYAWYLGRPDYKYDNVHAAKSAHNGTVWRQLSDDYYNNSDYSNNSQVHPIQGVFDTLAIAKPRSAYDYSSYDHAGYLAYRGSVNGVTGKPELGWFYYIEGRGGDNNYGSSPLPYALYKRGTVKFCATGGASLPPFATYNDLNGQTWMSAGGYGVQFIQVG